MIRSTQHFHWPSSQIHPNPPFTPPHIGKSVISTITWRITASSLKVDIQTPNLNVLTSKEVMEDEKKYIVGTYARTPVVLSSGKGCKLYDIEGREYLDLSSGIAVNALGHGDQDWVEAVVEQANTLTHVSNLYYSIPQVVEQAKTLTHVSNLYYSLPQVGFVVKSTILRLGGGGVNKVVELAKTLTHVSNLYYSLPQIELAKRLVTSSFADRVFFTNSGTEANEAAIKFSRKFQRTLHSDKKQPPFEFIAYSNCFHGRTMGALALTSKEHYRIPFEPVMPGVHFLEYGDTQASVDLIRSGKIAAVFVEPIQGEGGIYSATVQFLQSLRNACDQTGSLLVFDEIQCGLGRTGYLWAHEAYGIYPDIMTLAKPLAGGLPIGAVLVKEKVSNAIDFGDHASTFAGSPLVCHAATATLNKISDPSFLANVSKMGEYFKELLVQKLGSNIHVKEIRGAGLIIGIELDVSASALVDSCRKSGLLVLTAGKGNVVRLVPPLIISEEELHSAAEILADCISVLEVGNST